ENHFCTLKNSTQLFVNRRGECWVLRLNYLRVDSIKLSVFRLNSCSAFFAPLKPCPACRCLKIAPPSMILINIVPILINVFPERDNMDKIKKSDPTNSKKPINFNAFLDIKYDILHL